MCGTSEVQQKATKNQRDAKEADKKSRENVKLIKMKLSRTQGEGVWGVARVKGGRQLRHAI